MCFITVGGKFFVLTKYVDIYPKDLIMHSTAEDADMQAAFNLMNKIHFFFLFMICQSCFQKTGVDVLNTPTKFTK